jgi:hypothetical protein
VTAGRIDVSPIGRHARCNTPRARHRRRTSPGPFAPADAARNCLARGCGTDRSPVSGGSGSLDVHIVNSGPPGSTPHRSALLSEDVDHDTWRVVQAFDCEGWPLVESDGRRTGGSPRTPISTHDLLYEATVGPVAWITFPSPDVRRQVRGQGYRLSQDGQRRVTVDLGPVAWVPARSGRRTRCSPGVPPSDSSSNATRSEPSWEATRTSVTACESRSRSWSAPGDSYSVSFGSLSTSIRDRLEMVRVAAARVVLGSVTVVGGVDVVVRW